MSKHVTISPHEAADHLAIRELVSKPTYIAPIVAMRKARCLFYSRYAHRRIHERQGSEAFAGTALARGAWTPTLMCFRTCRTGLPLG